MAEEIKDMLFRSSQLDSVRDALQHIQSDVEAGMKVDDELQELEATTRGLEVALMRMEKLGKREQDDSRVPNDDAGPRGLASVPPTHEVIFNHSRGGPHARYVWISMASTVDGKGNLGHPTSREEIRKFGDKARNMFLRKSPSVLLKSFMEAAMSWENERPTKHPWAAPGEEERAPLPDRRVED
jgi:hypothetical protein